MANILDWQEAKTLVENGNDFQYNQAIDYYLGLKRKLFQQFSTKTEKEIDSLINQSISNAIDKSEEDVLQITTKELNQLSTKTLDEIRKFVIEQFDGDNREVLIELGQQVLERRELIEKEKRSNDKVLAELKSKILQTLNFKDGKIENYETWMKTILFRFGISGFIDFSTVVSEIQSALYQNVYNYVKLLDSESNPYISQQSKMKMGGYLKEVIEPDLVKKRLEKCSLFTNVKNIGGKNTISDIVIGSIDDDLSDLESFFSGEESSVYNVEYSSNIFGGQIKSRDIQKITTQAFKVSHQKQLANKFNEMIDGSENKYSWACGVVFLGKYANILQSLGKQNILFISGPTQYFMDEFISTFRKKNMYLAFQMDKNHKATSQVALQRFLDAKKNTLLNRFA